ncbi:MAG: hypothetical protein ACUVX8_07120 [Candidatus Zipacnadales bacterium]
MTKTRALVVILIGCLFASGAWAGKNPYRNISNRPFAAISNGPQGAIIVEESDHSFALADKANRQRAISAAIAEQHSPTSLKGAVAALRFMQKCGVKSRKTEIRAPRIAVHTANGRALLPDLDRATVTGAEIGDPNNQIAFQFEGWSASAQAVLENYLSRAMDVARSVYGPPAFNITVKVIADRNVQALQGGIYDVTTNEIRMPPPPTSGWNVPEDTFVLMMLILHAFHDDVALFFDNWEQGMAGAAATIIQTTAGVSPDYRPEIGPFYAMPVYEPNNQPALGNSTWYPESGFGVMFDFRVAMARAAWMKCHVEDNQFFKRFNTQYYAQLNGLPPAQRTQLAGDTPALVEICERVLPTVEGVPFASWYRQQYALDTSISIGRKLLVWNVPVQSVDYLGNVTDGVMLILVYYTTDPSGNEMARSGTAQLTYWDYTLTRSLFAQEGYEIVIPSDPNVPGMGLLFPNFFNVGGAQRVTVQLELDGLYGRYPFPLSSRRMVEPRQSVWENETSIYGTIVGANEGTIDIEGLGGLKGIEVVKGAWSGDLANRFLSPGQLSVTYDDGNGNVISRLVNVGYDSYGVIIRAGTRTGLTKHFSYGLNGLYMISVPLLAIRSDPAMALGIPRDRILLARWKPTAPSGGKYEFYPNIDPIEPGRGYWLRVLEDTTIAVDGVLPDEGDDVTTPLSPGWNQIGCGRNYNVSTNDLLIQSGNDALSYAEAVEKRWVQAGFWSYSQRSGYNLTSTLQPFGGYWLRCLLPQGAMLVFPAGGATSARAAKTVPAEGVSPYGKTRWQTRLVLDYGASVSEVVLGTATTASEGYDFRHDLQAPPPFGEAPTLRFTQPDWGDNAGDYASDIRGIHAKGPWRLRVLNLPKGAKATLRWPDLTQVPRGLRMVLTDRTTGRQIHMRTAAGYEFVGTETPREFEITLRPGTAGALAVTGMASNHTPQGVAITYTLTVDAAVTARVLNLTGHPIRELVRNKSETAGRATLLWDLKSANGLLVPNGLYLVEVTARAEDGQVARGLSQIAVTR